MTVERNKKDGIKCIVAAQIHTCLIERTVRTVRARAEAEVVGPVFYAITQAIRGSLEHFRLLGDDI